MDLKEQRRERRDRVYRYLADGYSHRQAMKKFGLAHESFYSLLDQIKAEHPDVDNLLATKGKDEPEIDPGSLRARMRLAQLLWSYRDNGGQPLHRSAVAEALGLPARAQLRAEGKPYTHDWTFDQITRLAEAIGDTFENLLKKVAY